jgi:hypothetical protein
MLDSLLWCCVWKYQLHHGRVTLRITISAAFRWRLDEQEMTSWPLQSVPLVACLFRLYLVPWIMNWISRTVPRRSMRRVLWGDYTDDSEKGPVYGRVDSTLQSVLPTVVFPSCSLWPMSAITKHLRQRKSSLVSTLVWTESLSEWRGVLRSTLERDGAGGGVDKMDLFPWP